MGALIALLMSCIMGFMNTFRVRVLDLLTTGIVWAAVLMMAYGLGNLAEAIVDTVRYGHPR